MSSKLFHLKVFAAAVGLALPAFAAPTTTIHLSVPQGDAQVYFDDTLTQQQGTSRLFTAQTQDLNVGQTYHYNVRAVVQADGQTYDKTIRMDFVPGDYLEVAFNWDQNAKSREGKMLAGFVQKTVVPVPVQPTCAVEGCGCQSGCEASVYYAEPAYEYPVYEYVPSCGYGGDYYY